MFRTITLVVLEFTLVLLVLLSVWSLTIKKSKRQTFARRAAAPTSPLLRRTQQFLFAGTILSALALAGTGFWAALVRGEPMRGYNLMVHCSIAVVFVISLTLYALVMIFSQKSRWSHAMEGLQSLCFWLIIMVGPVVILSMALSMTPLAGMEGQAIFYHLHRYAALAITILICFYVFLIWVNTGDRKKNAQERIPARNAKSR